MSALARPLRIGTRGSVLALWQAREVARRLEAAGEASEIVVIRTSGDRLSEEVRVSSCAGGRMRCPRCGSVRIGGRPERTARG